jgi:voltage-gated potassium channel
MNSSPHQGEAMENFEENRRQIRLAAFAILVIIPFGILGYMLLESMSIIDATWMTVVTLSTVGYGDIVPQTAAGRIFTLVLVVVGLASFVYAGQAVLGLVFSPELVRQRERQHVRRMIRKLRGHYVICGEGELVESTVETILARAEQRRATARRVLLNRLNRIPIIGGTSRLPLLRSARRSVRRLILRGLRHNTLLDAVVVVTQDHALAVRLRRLGLLAIEGDSADDEILLLAGIDHAAAMMVMESSDTETLLTVLTANNRMPSLLITAAAYNEAMAPKMLRVGANNVIAPLDVAGQFLNSVTFRPAVNAFFQELLFGSDHHSQVVQCFMYDDSQWIGQRLGDLELDVRFGAVTMAIRRGDGMFMAAPAASVVLEEDEVLLVICPADNISSLIQACRAGTPYRPHPATWQRLVNPERETRLSEALTEQDSLAAIQEMKRHYIICADGVAATSALRRLSPERPFVIVSNDEEQTKALLERGFRVLHGDATEDAVLRRAGIEHALAIMITIEDRASAVLVALASRTMNRRLLITAAADSEELRKKLIRAGADRVITPYTIAAQLMLMATTRPVVSEFMQYVLYNRVTQLETVELYIEDDSPWIGKRFGDLGLTERFSAHILGVRQLDHTFTYVPDDATVIEEGQIIIALTTMQRFDALRVNAYGSVHKRPSTLRSFATSPNSG